MPMRLCIRETGEIFEMVGGGSPSKAQGLFDLLVTSCSGAARENYIVVQVALCLGAAY